MSPTIVLITDPRSALEHLEHVITRAARALPSGALLVQLRDKAAPDEALRVTAGALRAVTARLNAGLVVNAPSIRFLQVAREVAADGAHVSCRPDAIAEARAIVGPSAWVSAPAHDDDDVRVAADAGANAVLVSPIYESPGKGPARGIEALTRARERARTMRVYALGGVDPSNVAACGAARAHGVAVIRALLDAADPAEAARRLDAPFRS